MERRIADSESVHEVELQRAGCAQPAARQVRRPLEYGLSGDYIGDSGRSERDASDTSCEPHDSAAASRRRTAASFPTTESNSFTGSDTVPPVNAIRIG